MAQIRAKPAPLPSKFKRVTKGPAEEKDLNKLLREREGIPPVTHSKQWLNPLHHIRLLGSAEVEDVFVEGARVWRYRWLCNVYTTFLHITLCNRMGEAWLQMGSFSLDGCPKWSIDRLKHMAASFGGSGLQKLLTKVMPYRDVL